MAVAYKSAGAGTGTQTNGADLSPLCPATVDPNDILIAHIVSRATANPGTPGFSPANGAWTLLRGPDTITLGNDIFVWIFGKIADGTEDGAAQNFGSSGAGTQPRWARIYSFSGYVGGAITDVVPAASFSFTDDTGASFPAPDVTTTQAGSLAVALVTVSDDNAVGSFTGETGGDWTEAVAEFAHNPLASDICMQIQTCTPTSDPGSVTGGSFTMGGADDTGIHGFEIKPGVATTPTFVPKVVML